MGLRKHAYSSVGTSKMAHRTWRSVVIFCIAIVFFVPLYHLRNRATADYYKQYIYDHLSRYLGDDGVYENTLYQHGTEQAVHSTWNFSTPCDNFPDTDDILLVMKTGATESFDKLPTQLLTTMQCLPDFLLFSDLEQQLGKYHVYNVLDRVDEFVKRTHGEFDLYDEQLNCPVSQKDCTTGLRGGWDLDKYKFLNMVVRTWEMRPGKKWYVFAEADTYIIWSNLVRYLRERARTPDSLYVGSVAQLNRFPFAHGGSGYVVSGALIQQMVETIPNLGSKYDIIAGTECCGDILMAKALDEIGVRVKQAHPMFNGEKPNTLPFGNGHWCEPIMTMHHMNSEEISSVWQYEQTRTKNELMQIKDLYFTFFAPNLVTYRNEWDNLADDVCYVAPDTASQDKAIKSNKLAKIRQKREDDKNAVEKHAHESAAACAKVCEATSLDISKEEYDALESEEDRGHLVRARYDQKLAAKPDFNRDRKCFQWRYHHGTCWTSRSFKLGRPRREGKTEDKWTSGWFVNGINSWIETRGDCDGVEWKEPTTPA